MNIYERIVYTLTAKPMTFFELHTAIDASTDPNHLWTEECISTFLATLEFRELVGRKGEKYVALPNKFIKNDEAAVVRHARRLRS